ncbi:MAG: PqqD family protein [Thermoplasmatales archaeon]|nr:PqqD family protein [Thermoplasmatales archaeon]
MNYLEKCFDKNLDIVSRKIADEYILVPIRDNVGDLESIYTLNEVGAFIWKLVNGKRKVKEIKEMIVEEFEVSGEEAEKDLIEFIQQLEGIGVLALKGG